MKLQPVQFPYFFYGTLMEGEKYYDRIRDYQATISTAYAHGTLYYCEYTDEKNRRAITAALDPAGAQRIQGYLFTPRPECALETQAVLDELEFNFYNFNCEKKRDRVYLRNIISCYTETGESYLAWCYLYYSASHELRIQVNPNNALDTPVKFEKITLKRYQELVRQHKL